LSVEETGTGLIGLISAPHNVVCKMIQAQIENVNFQSLLLINMPISGANTKEPTPLPAIVIPVAMPLFLSKYSAIMINEAMYVQPVDRPVNN
jgi:hypothetical protein